MDMQIRFRNNDLGPYMPTHQERMNSMLSAGQTASSAAPELTQRPVETPHLLNNDELQQTLQQVEAQAAQQNEQMMQAHSGLNEQRVARLLGLLD